MSTGGWLTKMRGTIKGRASFTNIQIDVLNSIKKNSNRVSGKCLERVMPLFACSEMHRHTLWMSGTDQTDLMDQFFFKTQDENSRFPTVSFSSPLQVLDLFKAQHSF